MVWYRARAFRWFTAHTTVAGVRFRSGLGGGSIVGLWLAYLGAWMLVASAASALAFVALGETLQELIRALDDARGNPQEVTANVTGFLEEAAPALIASAIAYYLGARVIANLILGHRGVRIIVRTLSIERDADLATIAQAARRVPRWGEGLADALDSGGMYP